MTYVPEQWPMYLYRTNVSTANAQYYIAHNLPKIYETDIGNPITFHDVIDKPQEQWFPQSNISLLS